MRTACIAGLNARSRCQASPTLMLRTASTELVRTRTFGRFFTEAWTVGSEADRIGYRYKGGSALSFQPREQPFGAGSDPSNIVDSCYPIGSIQVPAGLEPIILHRDAVSGGGYAMIGTVISADLDLIGQMQPNQQARLLAVSLKDALQARRSYKKKLGFLARLFG